MSNSKPMVEVMFKSPQHAARLAHGLFFRKYKHDRHQQISEIFAKVFVKIAAIWPEVGEWERSMLPPNIDQLVEWELVQYNGKKVPKVKMYSFSTNS